MVTQQSINFNIGDKFEEDVHANISDECLLAAEVNETSGGHSTPDIVCVEKGENGKDITRLIEAKFDSYVRPDQREELGRIAERTPATTRIQVAHLDDDGFITITSIGSNTKEGVMNELKNRFDSPKTDNQDRLREKYMEELQFDG
jgi:hypothetical protein